MKQLPEELDHIRMMLGEQLKQVSSVVASSATVEGVLAETSKFFESGLSALSGTVRQLALAVQPTLQTIAYQAELQTAVLGEIKEILTRPLSIQEKELRKRAEFAYFQGWIPEAEKDLLKAADLNYQDFTVHHLLGMIALYHNNDPSAAELYFERAAKYAKPRSTREMIKALEQLAIARWRCGKRRKALEAALQILGLHPDDTEVQYQVARYRAHVDGPDKFLDELDACVKLDPKYLIVAEIDPVLQDCRAEVFNLACRLRNQLRELLEEQVSYLECLKREASPFGFDVLSLERSLLAVRERIAIGGYLDLLEISPQIEKLCKRYPNHWKEEADKARRSREDAAEEQLHATVGLGAIALGVAIILGIAAGVAIDELAFGLALRFGFQAGLLLFIGACIFAFISRVMASIRLKREVRSLADKMSHFKRCRDRVNRKELESFFSLLERLGGISREAVSNRAFEEKKW